MGRTDWVSAGKTFILQPLAFHDHLGCGFNSDNHTIYFFSFTYQELCNPLGFAKWWTVEWLKIENLTTPVRIRLGAHDIFISGDDRLIITGLGFDLRLLLSTCLSPSETRNSTLLLRDVNYKGHKNTYSSVSGVSSVISGHNWHAAHTRTNTSCCRV